MLHTNEIGVLLYFWCGETIVIPGCDEPGIRSNSASVSYLLHVKLVDSRSALLYYIVRFVAKIALW